MPSWRNKVLQLLALFLVLIVTYSLVTVGEFVLGRLAWKVSEWNISFLVGLSVASTAFFPLSLLFGSQALNVTVCALALCGDAGLTRRILELRKTSPPTGRPVPSVLPDGLAAKLLAGMLALVVIQFAIENYRLAYTWDGFQIWATKALVIYNRGELTQSLMTPHTPELSAFPNCCDGSERFVGYPQTVSLFEALVAKSEGQFVWEAVKAVFPIFFISLLLSTFECARAFVPRVPALAASLLLGLIPVVASEHSIGGYADMPQGCLLAGCLAALFRRGDSISPSYRIAFPWILCGVLIVKNEGAVLFGITCAAIAIVWSCGGSKEFVAQLRRYSGAIVVLTVCAFLRAIYISWVDTKDPTYGPFDQRHFALAYSRLWTVPVTCAHFMFNRADWGLFWLVFLVAAPLVIWKGKIRERALVVGSLTTIAVYNSIFYFTNWHVELHIDQAYSRLLVQLSPVAAVVTVIGYKYLAGESRVSVSPSTQKS